MSRKTHPPYYRIIRVLCTGRVDPLFIFEAFKSGADGVIICGCRLGECKYFEGNLQALITGEFVKILMKELGLNENRLKLSWVASNESAKLVIDLAEFFETIRNLGSLGSEENWNEEDKILYLNCASKICKDVQIRTILGNIATEIKSLKEFSHQTIAKKLEEKLFKRLRVKLLELEVKELIKRGIKDFESLLRKIKTDREDLERIYFQTMKQIRKD